MRANGSGSRHSPLVTEAAVGSGSSGYSRLAIEAAVDGGGQVVSGVSCTGTGIASSSFTSSWGT